MMIRWMIYYVDGSTFSSEDGNPEDARGWGVAAVVQEDDVVNVQVHHLKDFYCFAIEFGGWVGLDYFGFAQYLSRPGFKIVKLGDYMPTKAYRDLIDAIQDDPLLPSKSTRYGWERQF